MVLDPTPKPQRKLIQAPRFNISAEDEEEDDLSDIPPSSPRLGHMSVVGTGAPRSPDSQTPTSTPTSPWSRMAFDLAKYGNTGTPERRHSITLCETPSLTHQSSITSITPPSSLPQSRNPSAPNSPAHQDFVASASQTQREFLSSAHFSSRLDCLALTLEEVVHIRNVLTKADLEALPLDLTIKEDMARGKICFLCMKTRFGFFGPRGTNCRLCKRTVCKKCISKMRIPTEHFSNIPVQMLTPQALSPREDEDDSVSLPRSILSRLTDLPLPGSISGAESGERRSSVSGSVGSAPSSPMLSRAAEGPASLPAQPPAPYVNEAIKKKQKQRSRTTQVEEHLRGELMSVCGDCKAMVLHILASIKVRREQQMSGSALHESPRHHLHLNLTPVYH
ncbi:protein spire-like isoform X2 [Homarus americanus]|uniref:protein spire-like isoform X2 n=1 Tax=Homarus americanus TaxID=6706 RepID=UPI001C441217|nr:protein spire-like isoform X2 [Homarus americanus]